MYSGRIGALESSTVRRKRQSHLLLLHDMTDVAASHKCIVATCSCPSEASCAESRAPVEKWPRPASSSTATASSSTSTLIGHCLISPRFPDRTTPPLVRVDRVRSLLSVEICKDRVLYHILVVNRRSPHALFRGSLDRQNVWTDLARAVSVSY